MWELSISLLNEGEVQATDVWDSVTTDDENIEIRQDTVEFSGMPSHSAGAIPGNPLIFSRGHETPFHSAPFDLSIFSNDDSYTITHSFEIVIERADILLADDDGGDDIELYYTGAFDGRSWSHERYDRSAVSDPDMCAVNEYKTLIWFTGSEHDSTLTSSDQEWLRVLRESGGNLFLRGQNIAADLIEIWSDPSQYPLWASDYNGESQVSILDVVGIANLILGREKYSH